MFIFYINRNSRGGGAGVVAVAVQKDKDKDMPIAVLPHELFALLLIKMADRGSVHLTRGKHETTDMNQSYGFEAQVLARYDKELWDFFGTNTCSIRIIP